MSSKIRRQPVDLPIPVASRFRSVAARDFLWPLGRQAIAFGAAGGGFGKRALGCRR